MNNQSNQSIQPSELEQVVVPTIEGLRQCEALLGYEFQEAIYTIQKLYDLQQDPMKSARDYAEASGHGVARRIVEVN